MSLKTDCNSSKSAAEIVAFPSCTELMALSASNKYEMAIGVFKSSLSASSHLARSPAVSTLLVAEGDSFCKRA